MPRLRNYHIEGLKLEDRQSSFSYFVGNNLALAMKMEKNIESDDFTAAFCGDSNESRRLTPSRPVCKEEKLPGNETKLSAPCHTQTNVFGKQRQIQRDIFVFTLAIFDAERAVDECWGCRSELHGTCKGCGAARDASAPQPRAERELQQKLLCGQGLWWYFYTWNGLKHGTLQRTSCWPSQQLAEGGNSFQRGFYFKGGETEEKKKRQEFWSKMENCCTSHSFIKNKAQTSGMSSNAKQP